jgi:hypothetical protein
MYFNYGSTPCVAGECYNPLAIIEHTTPRSAVVRWAPTPEEQRQLAIDGVRGQLVVESDVDRLTHPHQTVVCSCVDTSRPLWSSSCLQVHLNYLHECYN